MPVDFRLVAATNEVLEERVRDGAFREDLYSRLNVFPIRVPPLRERKEDIPVLANAFRLRFAEQNGIDAPPILPETLSRLMAYDWPGNVRELENVIERSLIMHHGSRSLPIEPGTTATGGKEGERHALERAARERWDLDRLEREYILSVNEPNTQAKLVTRPGLRTRELDEPGCRALLGRRSPGRLAFSFRDRVDIQPLNFVLDGEWIFGRTSEGEKMNTLRHHRWIAIQELSGPTATPAE